MKLISRYWAPTDKTGNDNKTDDTTLGVGCRLQGIQCCSRSRVVMGIQVTPPPMKSEQPAGCEGGEGTSTALTPASACERMSPNSPMISPVAMLPGPRARSQCTRKCGQSGAVQLRLAPTSAHKRYTRLAISCQARWPGDYRVTKGFSSSSSRYLYQNPMIPLLSPSPSPPPPPPPPPRSPTPLREATGFVGWFCREE